MCGFQSGSVHNECKGTGSDQGGGAPERRSEGERRQSRSQPEVKQLRCKLAWVGDSSAYVIDMNGKGGEFVKTTPVSAYRLRRCCFPIFDAIADAHLSRTH